MTLVVEDLSKRFPRRDSGEDFLAVRDITFRVEPGEIAMLIGPSGCGKSTVLNCIAGLLGFEGKAELRGEPIVGPGTDRALVFQHASLLPWRTVRGNIAYGMQMQRAVDKRVIKERCDWAIQLVRLEEFADYYPSQLSGGMQQRVNLARALVIGAPLVLMDEPFGALDAMTRERLQDDLMRICTETGQSVVFVTHDITEAVYLGDKVVAMGANPGRILDIRDVPFPRPRDREVMNTLEFRRMCADLRALLEH